MQTAVFSGMQKNSKNYVKIIKNISSDLMKHRLAKPILLFLLLSNLFTLFFGMFMFWFNTDHRYLMDFGPRWGLELSLALNLWTVLNKLEEYNEFIEWCESVHIPYEIMDEKLNQRAEEMAKILKFSVFAYYGMICIGFIAVNSNQEQILRKNYFLKLICENLPGACSVKTYIISFVDASAYFVAASSPMAVLYLGISGIYKVMMINEIAGDITSSQISSDHRYDSELYQKIVQQKLKICVMLHSTIIRISLAGGDLVYTNLILMVFVAIIAGTALIFSILTAFGEEEYTMVIGWLFLGICGFLILAIYVTIGQLLENESERLWYILVQLPWYYMNKENALIYSILLKKSEVLISVGSELMKINFLLLLRIYRALYSLAAFLMQMSR